MAQVHHRFSIYWLFAAYQTGARLKAGLADAAKRRSDRRRLNSVNDLSDGERRSSCRRQGASQYLPGSVFDARYKGLAVHAARLDAGICRQERLR
jgi:hypothetical protein